MMLLFKGYIYLMQMLIKQGEILKNLYNLHYVQEQKQPQDELMAALIEQNKSHSEEQESSCLSTSTC